jgi:hypothetical protein
VTHHLTLSVAVAQLQVSGRIPFVAVCCFVAIDCGTSPFCCPLLCSPVALPPPHQPRQHPDEKLPSGPGYLCPQQVRLWLQEQQQQQQQCQGPSAAPAPGASAEPGCEGRLVVGDDGPGPAAAGQTQHKAKRLKSGEPARVAGVTESDMNQTAQGDSHC